MRVPYFSALVCYASLAAIHPSMAEANTEPKANPILAPRQAQSFTFDLSGEFLYWKLESFSLDYIRTGVGVATTAGTPEIPVNGTGKPYSPNFKYQPGFRVAAAVYFGPMTAYDITTRYTRYYSNASGHFLSSKDRVADATAITFLVEDGSGRIQMHSASLNAKTHLNFIDAVGGYTLDVTKHLFFRPFAGLSGQINSLDLRARYAFLQTVGITGEEIHIHKSHTSSWGIGPIVGLDGTWNMSRNWSIFGTFNFRTPWVRSNIRDKQKEIRITRGDEFYIVQGKLTVDHVAFSYDFLIGPQWDVWFFNDNCHLTLRAAWEWFIMSAANTVYLNAANADNTLTLEIQGLTVSAAFEF